MSASPSAIKKPGRPRGRRAAPRVPCDTCIARASEKEDDGAEIQLCESCTSTLHRPRRKPEQIAAARRARRRSSASTATDFSGPIVPDSLVEVSSNPDQPEQQRNFEFFMTHTAAFLADYFEPTFWRRAILQNARQAPAVRHAVAAIGALHERLLHPAVHSMVSEDERTQFAIEQCNKSIQYLTTPSSPAPNTDTELLLTTSILYTCFEAIQGHNDEAVMHAMQAYDLLQQYAMDPENRRWDVGAFAVELSQQCLLIPRPQSLSLDRPSALEWLLPARTLSHAESSISNSYSHNNNRSSGANSPACPTLFSSLQQAWSTLEPVTLRLQTLFRDMELDDELYRLALLDSKPYLTDSSWLADWEAAYSSFFSNNSSALSADDRREAMVLKSHHLVAEILSGVDLAQGEAAWDAWLDHFAAIVNLAAAVLALELQDSRETIVARKTLNNHSAFFKPASFSFELGIVDPLHEVCARCRDASLRRRALQLLATHPRQDCVWSSSSVWKTGRVLMDLQDDDKGILLSDLPKASTYERQGSSISHGSMSLEKRHQRLATRTKARVTLNPGLYDEKASIQRREQSTAVVNAERHDSIAPNLPIPADAALHNFIPAEPYIPTTWLDYEALNCATSLSTISESLPGD